MADTPPELEQPSSDPLRLVTIALVALMIVAFIGSTTYQIMYAQGERQARECYQAAFDELNASLAVSRETARQDRAQLRTLVTSLTAADATVPERQLALATYLRALDEADVERSRAPLPTRTCR